MLINEPSLMRAKELRQGVYEIGHFGGTNFMRGYEQYPETTVGPYGVCDSVEQLLAACPELEDRGREFVVTVTPVCKDDEPDYGGWRWHKWGKYIGTQNPQCEYIRDEPSIDEVLCFHIYERANV